jgi:hypothetical protein
MKMSIPQVNILPFLSPSFEHYITLERVHPTQTYNYAKRNMYGLRVIEATRHLPKGKQGDSWLYVAVPSGASLETLTNDERLYVGSQTQDRMFRGDDLGGDNYHHAEMREGNGSDNPINFLHSGRKIEIHRISARSIAATLAHTGELAFLEPLTRQPRTPKSHTAYWFEQYILFVEAGRWRWNTAAATSTIVSILGE